MADVLAYKIVPGCDHHVSLPAVSHTLQDLAHAQGNGGLTSSWGASEAHVERRHSRVEAELAAHLRPAEAITRLVASRKNQNGVGVW